MSHRKPRVTLTRKETISACHRLHNDSLSAKENLEIYGKCNNSNGHGHNYEILVSVKGEIDPVTGMVMNLTDLKEYVQKAVVEPLDHKNLDKDVPGLSGMVTTTENLAVFIWNNLLAVMPLEVAPMLYEVVINETDKNRISYKGE